MLDALPAEDGEAVRRDRGGMGILGARQDRRFGLGFTDRVFQCPGTRVTFGLQAVNRPGSRCGGSVYTQKPNFAQIPRYPQ
ncbi:MAG: hypothetical protein H6905_10095 [Hyphomicrobiales bacterium]|nr:hypothetical protein [Hyphomicrobiales bacterium]